MKLLDTVALVKDMPTLNLYRGQVGTIVLESSRYRVECDSCTQAIYTI